jgi:hypothetical protein
MASPSKPAKVSVIIPALNEQDSIGLVLGDIPRDLVTHMIVVDNGSTDDTAEVARAEGARVVFEPRRGYGQACLTGIASLPAGTDVVVFLDGDHSDHPEEMPRLLRPILEDRADMVIGSRTLGTAEHGALTPQQVVGNRLACLLMRVVLGVGYTDLGPFRAIRLASLMALEMEDRSYGWTVEMQMKAIHRGLRVSEVPVSYRRRVGHSKISGTVLGSIRAGAKILVSIARYAFDGH